MSRRGRTRPAEIGPSQRVLGVVMVLLGIDVVLLAALGNLQPRTSGVEIGVVTLGAAFAFVEWRVIHVQFRAEASSFSLFEIPLVLGLLYTPPGHLVMATVGGAALGLLAGRRQPPLKVAFNAANLGMFAGVAAMVVGLAPFGANERLVWLSILVAVLVGSAASFAQIVLVVTLTEGFPGWARTAELLAYGLVVSLTTSTLGLTAGIVLDRDVFAVALLAIPALLLFGALRLIMSEREQRERIEFLYRSTRRLDIGASESGLVTLLQEAREMFRAEIGAVVLKEGDTIRVVQSASSGERSYALTKVREIAAVNSALAAFGEPELIGRDDQGALAELIAGVGGRDAMVAKLQAEKRDLGLLVVANRLGEVTSFTDNDLQVLGALARQSAILMHSDRLEQALTELRQLEKKLAYQASHDSLTGLPNRSVFAEALQLAVGSSRPHSLLFIDLDGFKRVNDTFGHAGGDAVLVEVARRLSQVVRPEDTVSRFGGDEFAVLLADVDEPSVIARRIVDALAKPVALPHGQATIGCSIGLVAGARDGDPEWLLRQADTAMYQAKQSGKGMVVEHQTERRVAQQGTADLLADAIRDDQLELHYQPIVDLSTRRVCGVEALVRWRHPERGVLLPGEFLGEPERNGLTGRIDEWVLATGAAELADVWTLDPELYLSVNLTPRHLIDGSIGELLAIPALEQAPGRIVIEWSEEVLVDEIDRSEKALSAAHAAGALVALDRFGDGRASLGYLQRLDIDVVKLGARMASRLAGADGSVRFLHGIIEVTHALGMRVVADCIEDPRQLTALQTTGCDMAQGFLFARPMRAADLSDLIAQIAARPSPGPARTSNRLT